MTTISKEKPEGRVALRRQELRRRLMAAGVDCFGSKGIDGTGMSELLSAAGTSPGAFYKLYDSKDVFVGALIEAATNPVGDIIEAAGENSGDLVETIALGLRITLELARRYPGWGRFIAQTALTSFAKQTGLGPRVSRDVVRAKQASEIDDEDDLLLVALVFGTFLSGVSAAGVGLLTPEMILGLVERTLLGLGVSSDRAKACVQSSTDNYVDTAVSEGRELGIFTA